VTKAFLLALALGVAVVVPAGAQAAKPLPGLQTDEAPWPADHSMLRERLAAMGLPAMPEEKFAIHIHQMLTIKVRGQDLIIPAGIGIQMTGRFLDFISPIHTHEPNGQIHIESGDPNAKFTLGQFFDVWGVRFTSKCIGGYCAAGADSLKVSVDGKPVKGDPRAIVLHDLQQIDVTFGGVRKGPYR
jgi:hypothetical protein